MIAHQKFESPVRRHQPGQPVSAQAKINACNFVMNELMRILIELQSLEFEETIQPNIEERIAKLRAKIPRPILAHYDRLGDQGKKGVAPLRNQICTGCHIRVPVAVVFNLKHGEDVCLCDNCGRYLYLPEIAVEAVSSATKKIAAKNGRKQLAHAL